MHGTTLNGTALEQTQKRLVESGDNVVVGSDVILGTSKFAYEYESGLV